MKKKATIITYGCQMNVNESAKLKKLLQDMQYEIIDDINDSDAVFLNTCTVREGAARKVYGKLGELKSIKKKKKGKFVIGVTGCFAQEQGDELAKKVKHVDIVMGNQNISKIPEIIEKLETQELEPVILIDNEDELPPRVDAEFDDGKTASIAITYGCNNFCAYCIVPYVRGRERSVPMDELLREIGDYVAKGYKEIVLLGQNVNSYGKDLGDENSFANLLKEICKINGEFWVRFISPHPRDFTDEVIDIIADNDKIARSLHLPLQAGASDILKNMNRGYTKEQYIELAEKIKSKVSGSALTTDIIVGFPGESEENFQDTLDVVKKVEYDNAFMFMYSIRKGTKAADMIDQVPDEVKSDRLQRLISVQNSIAKRISETYVGEVVRVLVEGSSKKNKDMLSGRTSTNKIVLFEGNTNLAGKFVDVRINEARTWTLYGEIIE